MSKTIIRVKNQDYPYFTESEIKDNGDKIEFETINKLGKRRLVELAKSEIVSKETELDEAE